MTWNTIPITVTKRGARVCQDSASASRADEDSVVLAVADGAGSSNYSDECARWLTDACQSACSNALRASSESRSSPDGVRRMLNSAWDEIMAQYEEWLGGRPYTQSDCYSTLTLALIARDTIGVLRVGDGFVVIESNDVVTLALPPGGREGQYQNETDFVVAGIEPEIIVFVEPGAQMVAVSSDGAEKVLSKKRVILPDGTFAEKPVFWGEAPGWPLFSNLRASLRDDPSGGEVREYLASDVMKLKNDDIGLAIAAR